ncbi:hypothetical protein HYFRA_00002666 [Hymenoscyphus fraxineus]|uniref:Uncharacterized protein n=1 Tax=Hymenoscyphus fraxineus TaxID=746836 RepID=A0A9N9LAU6_9HELO|nr:hypothetical protein HYFRA_00002666 [Hymenoscyphus fraxineus]
MSDYGESRPTLHKRYQVTYSSRNWNTAISDIRHKDELRLDLAMAMEEPIEVQGSDLSFGNNPPVNPASAVYVPHYLLFMCSFQLYNEKKLPISHTVEVAESVAAMKVAMKGHEPDPKRCIIFESGSGPIWKVLET